MFIEYKVKQGASLSRLFLCLQSKQHADSQQKGLKRASSGRKAPGGQQGKIRRDFVWWELEHWAALPPGTEELQTTPKAKTAR